MAEKSSASGVLGAIANPAQVDVLGAVAAGRKTQARDLAGEILGQTFTGKLGALAQLDPDTALKLSQSLGIPTDSKGRLDNFKGIAIAANQLVQAGQVENAIQFLDEEATKIESATGDSRASQNIRAFIPRLQQGDEQAFIELSKLAAAFNPTKPVTLAKGARLVDPVSGKDIVSTPVDLPGKIEFKEFRTLNNDVTALIKEPLKIRRAAERLEKIGETKSPTDQLAAIFTFMKALDPTSVVREGEQQAASIRPSSL